MEIKKLPEKYKIIWQACAPYFKEGRPGGEEHAKEVVEFILNYQGDLKFDEEILIPVAMMHDIGYAAILPEHFVHVTGSKKILNGKLVHMLASAKIAKNILEKVGYNKGQSKEIVDIISIHDADQLKDVDIAQIYDTEYKKIFHDIDSLDRYNAKRLRGSFEHKEIFKALEEFLSMFFYDEFRKIAKNNLKALKSELC